MISDERFTRFIRSGFLLAPFFLLACSSGDGEVSVSSSSSLTPADPPITWTLKNPMPTPRTEFGVATVNNKISAIGGMNYIDVSQVAYSYATEEYDPLTIRGLPRLQCRPAIP